MPHIFAEQNFCTGKSIEQIKLFFCKQKNYLQKKEYWEISSENKNEELQNINKTAKIKIIAQINDFCKRSLRTFFIFARGF